MQQHPHYSPNTSKPNGGALVAAVAVAVLLMGAGMAAFVLLARAPAEPPPPVSVSSTDRFLVQLSVLPPHARIELDGETIPGNVVIREFPRDGRAHLLRVRADGYAPQEINFSNAPPPPVIALVAVPSPVLTPMPAPMPPPIGMPSQTCEQQCNGDSSCIAQCAASAGPRESPSREEVLRAMRLVSPAVRACATSGATGTAVVSITFVSTGRVSATSVSGPLAGTPTGACIAEAVRAATVQPFTRPTLNVNFPFVLR